MSNEGKNEKFESRKMPHSDNPERGNSEAEGLPTTPMDWAFYLRDHVEETGKCDFADWSGLEWGILLQKRPELVLKCDMESFTGEDWRHLLIVSGRFADKCKWELLNGDDWVILMSYIPELAKHCDWQKAKMAKPCFVAELLSLDPEFAENFDLSQLDGWSTGYLVCNQPRFERRCDLGKLDKLQWLSLLSVQPQFADKCDRENLGITDAEWSSALAGNPPSPNVLQSRVDIYKVL